MCGQEGDEAVRGPSATLRDSSQVECGNHSSSMLVGNLSLSDCLKLLHPIEDRLDPHPGTLPVSMKHGNSILAERCPRMRSFLSRLISLPLMHPQILRETLFSRCRSSCASCSLASRPLFEVIAS